jgi:hypothetical protein
MNINTINTENNKIVKSIFFVKTSKLDNDVRQLKWQYYRDRNRINVNDVISLINDTKQVFHTAEIIYKNDPVIYKLKFKKLESFNISE